MEEWARAVSEDHRPYYFKTGRMNTNSLSKNRFAGFSTINGRKMPPLRRLQMKRGGNEFRHPLKYDLFCLCRTPAHSAGKKAVLKNARR
jgi:hypothetical protein